MDPRSPWFRCWFGVLVAAVILGAPVGADANPHLDVAKTALDDLDYKKARAALDEALKWGRNEPAQVAEIYRLLGEVHASLGRRGQAEISFRRALSLAPDIELAAGTSPKISKPFAAARKSLGDGGRLAGRCEVNQPNSRVDGFIDSDPTEIVAGAKLLFLDRDKNIDADASPVVSGDIEDLTLPLPRGEKLEFFCVFVDQHGNHLLTVGSPEEPLLYLPKIDKPRSKRSFFSRWPLWGALTVAASGSAVYFGLEVRADRSELDELNQDSMSYDFSAAQAVADRGKRHALYTNISIGVAGAFAVATVLTMLKKPRREAKKSALVVPAPVDRGAGISLVGRF